MTDIGEGHLPPLPELLTRIEFPVIGLASPYLGLQLRSLHYGVEEEGGVRIIGLGLFYAQRYLNSPQVLAVESSQLPPSVPPENRQAAIEWSWFNFVNLHEALVRLHSTEPIELEDEGGQDQQLEASIATLKELEWAKLTRKSTFPMLVDMEVARGAEGEIFARRFSGSSMLLVVSLGLKPEEFLESMKRLIVLQEDPRAVQRHQEEFERLVG